MAKMQWNEACLLDPSLHCLDEYLSVFPEFVETLPGGLTNRCWKFSHQDGRDLVWRPVTTKTHAFAISRQQEHFILDALATVRPGLAPRVCFAHAKGLLVEWIKGSTPKSLPVSDMVRLLATIHDCHLPNLPVLPFSYTARIDHYWLQLLQDTALTNTLKPLYEKYRSVPNIDYLNDALCHFDLGVYNVVVNQEGQHVIDWEYASFADPRLDLALMIESNGFELAVTVAQYCQMRRIDEVDLWIEGVRAWRPRACLLGLLWCHVAATMTGNDVYKTMASTINERICQLGQ